MFSVLRVTEREHPFSVTSKLLVSSMGWLQVGRDALWADHTQDCLAEHSGHGLTSLTQEVWHSEHPSKLQKNTFTCQEQPVSESAWKYLEITGLSNT